MSEHEKHTEFLTQCLLYDESAGRDELIKEIARIQSDLHCLQRALWLMAVSGALIVVVLSYEGVLAQNFPYKTSQSIINLIFAAGVAVLISFLAFVGLWMVNRWKLDVRREECRQMVAKLLESRLGKPAIASWQNHPDSEKKRRFPNRPDAHGRVRRAKSNRGAGCEGGRDSGTFLLAGSLIVQADDDTISMPDVIQGAQQWAQENLDTNVLNALSGVDNREEQQFFDDLQQRFQGDYVVDLAALRQTAQTVLPLLQSRDETRPYAAWLQARMDYLDVADEIRLTIPPPTVPTNQPPLPSPNPPAQKERELWVKKVSASPWPALAKEYVPELKPIFTAQKIPPDLVWVAEVESGFDRRALSPAGAAGMFQLMPDTAKRFGLSLWPRDQRYQPDPSATASARYLKYLYDRFKDWRLALAAYNAGEGTVQKLLDRYKANSYDDIAGYLPAETQMYVPRIEAIIRQREGANLEQLSVPQS